MSERIWIDHDRAFAANSLNGLALQAERGELLYLFDAMPIEVAAAAIKRLGKRLRERAEQIEGGR